MEALAFQDNEGGPNSMDPHYEVIKKPEHNGRVRLSREGVTKTDLKKNGNKCHYIIPEVFLQSIQAAFVEQLRGASPGLNLMVPKFSFACIPRYAGNAANSDRSHDLTGEKSSATETHNSNQGPEVKPGSQGQSFSPVDQCKGSPGCRSLSTTNLEMTNQLDYNQYNLHLDPENHYFGGYNGVEVGALYAHPISGFLPNICPPPAAFLGPKCALWDCPRPAQGSDWWQDYCSSFHATLALNEGPPGMSPVLRPGGIGLKDGLLFAALSAKVQGKDVGIPECEGAATAKSPWNAPELFDLSVLEGETIREWLFFDKPRRAFEIGNRKQRSLPDYSGRGWHESRKQVMDEFSGLKRSYYMDPQPLNNYEWHLYEYEINKCDDCALYRLELKLVDRKKTPRGKTANDSVSELQKQMGRLTAEFPLDNRPSLKGRSKLNSKDSVGNLHPDPNQLTGGDKTFDHGVGAPYGYLVENIGDFYLK